MWTLTQIPVVQAPMAGSQGPKLCVAVCEAGGLGSIPLTLHQPTRPISGMSSQCWLPT